MHPTHSASGVAVAAILGTLFICACSGKPRPPEATSAPAPSAPQATLPRLTAQEQANISAHYLCGLHQVVVLARSDARIALNNGTQVRAGIIAGSKPPTYSGDGLTLIEAGPGIAELSDESGQSQGCRTVQTATSARAAVP